MPSPRRRVLGLLLAFSLSGGVSNSAHASPSEDAQAQFEAAAELYAKEEYEAAAREFAVAYALDPRLDILFAWAQAERLASDWIDAHRLFTRLLAREDLSDSQREAVTELQAEVAAAAAAAGIDLEVATTEAPATEPTAAASTEPAPPPPAQDTEPSRRRTLGITLTATGGVLVAAGAGLLVGGLLSDGGVRSAQTYSEFDQRYNLDTGRGRGALGLYAAAGVAGGVGLGLLISGALTLARAKSSSPERGRVGVSASAAGLRVQW